MAVTSTYRIHVSPGLTQTSMRQPHFLSTGCLQSWKDPGSLANTPDLQLFRCHICSQCPARGPCSHVFTLCGKLLLSSLKNSFPFGNNLKVN